MFQQNSASTAVDIVFCIDATGSMEPIIKEVKSIASSFHEKLIEVYDSVDRPIDLLRIKVITFRDFNVDTDALAESKFFELPAETEDFQAYINGITELGGGDEPENGLEALAAAMNSDWTNEGVRRRHVIALFTDASAIKLEDSYKSHPQYPVPAPASLEELQE